VEDGDSRHSTHPKRIAFGVHEGWLPDDYLLDAGRCIGKERLIAERHRRAEETDVDFVAARLARGRRIIGAGARKHDTYKTQQQTETPHKQNYLEMREKRRRFSTVL
jgi:hypothetical protein